MCGLHYICYAQHNCERRAENPGRLALDDFYCNQMFWDTKLPPSIPTVTHERLMHKANLVSKSLISD